MGTKPQSDGTGGSDVLLHSKVTADNSVYTCQRTRGKIFDYFGGLLITLLTGLVEG